MSEYVFPAEAFNNRPDLISDDPFLGDPAYGIVFILTDAYGRAFTAVPVSNYRDQVLLWNVEQKSFMAVTIAKEL